MHSKKSGLDVLGLASKSESFSTSALEIKNSYNAWLPILSLALAVFIFVTSEFVPVGLLTNISDGIGEAPSKTGLLLTGYAWVVAVMSLPLTLATGSVDRRLLLLALILIFSTGNLAATLFSSFYPLLLSRFIVALSHSVFWSIATPLAARLAPKGKVAYGLSAISAGGILGTVLGVPLGTFIGQRFAWQSTFALIAALSIVVFIILSLLLPKLPAVNTGSVKSLPKLIKNPPLIAAYGITCFLITGHFTLYTYIVPFLTGEVNIGETAVVVLLFVFGGSGIIGTLTAGKLLEKYMSRLLLSGILAIVLILAGIGLAKTSVFLVCALFVCWGIAMTIFGITMQSAILKFAPYAADAAVSIYSGIFNVGIGGGAFIGSVILTRYSAAALIPFSCLIALPALLIFSAAVMFFGFNRNS